MGVILQRVIVIIATAFSGAGMIVSGFIIFTSGGMVDAFMGIPYGEGITTAHAVGVFVLGVVGSIVQFATSPDEKKADASQNNPQDPQYMQPPPPG